MTEKEAKQELYSYLHSKRLEGRKLNQIEETKDKLNNISSVLSDMPKGSSNDDKMAENIAKLLDLVSEHIEIMTEEEEKLIHITNKIKLIAQPFRNILELRFVSGLKIEEVAVEINKEYRYTRKLIKKAILEYSKI